jgi:hypothetical protein
MGRRKADVGDLVDWEYPLGGVLIKGRNKVIQIVKYPSRPTSYVLDKGNSVRAFEIKAVVAKANACKET